MPDVAWRPAEAAADLAAARRREWTSAEASPYWPKTRARTYAHYQERGGCQERRWLSPRCAGGRRLRRRGGGPCAGSRCRRSGHAVQQPRSGRRCERRRKVRSLPPREWS
eukprot:scaffold3352_cov130-Isochrysis_galbana.AAC.6